MLIDNEIVLHLHVGNSIGITPLGSIIEACIEYLDANWFTCDTGNLYSFYGRRSRGLR